MAKDALRRRAEEIGDNALDFDAGGERDAYIQEACGQDEALRTLVSEYVRGGDNLPAEPVIREIPSMGSEAGFIGSWKLVRVLGEGGFGVVYLAERNDGQVRQLGAIKFLKGAFHSRDLELRFLDERQILANLNHPCIVRLIDADVGSGGQPYFVMEYVEDGLPIDQYCSQKDLSIKDRLQLFRKVCEGVAYAHRKLVVHRDLKPANILIGVDANPRILDFGVAKILDPVHRAGIQAPQSTRVLLGTERYFSPEQARREPVDTSTDIYTLGVILYELLVGDDPYDLAHHPKENVEHIICTVDPEPPSNAVGRTCGRKSDIEADSAERFGNLSAKKLRRQLQGDLDNIVLMALQKDVRRRYPSVDQFSEDIRRHLDGLPVSARRDTFAYRTGKFLRRHKVGVAAAALIFVSVIAGLSSTLWQARRAQAAQARAEHRFNDVRKLASSYLFEFHDQIAKVPGTTAARALVVTQALSYLDSLAKEESLDRDLQLELASAYQKVGDAQGRPGFASLGDRSGALQSYRQALRIRKILAANGPSGLNFRRDLATNYDRIGDTLLTTGQSDNALANYYDAYRLREASLSENPSDPDLRRDFASSCQRVAQAMSRTGHLEEAKRQQIRALAVFEPLAADRPNDAIIQRDLFISYIKEGDLLSAGSDKPGALTYYRRALPIAEAVERMADDPAKARRETANVHDKIGNLLAATNDTSGALKNYQAALNVRASLVAADRKNAEIQRDLSISYEKIGNMMVRLGKIDSALDEYRQSLRIDSGLLETDPDNAQARLDCASSQEKIGELLLKKEDFPGALASEDRARELREWVARKDQNNADVRGDLVLNYKQLGAINFTLAMKSRDPRYLHTALRWYEHGVDTLRELQRRRPLDQDEAGAMKDLAGEIAKCEFALKGDPKPQAASLRTPGHE